MLVTTWIGDETTNPNRNIAGKKNLFTSGGIFLSNI